MLKLRLPEQLVEKYIKGTNSFKKDFLDMLESSILEINRTQYGVINWYNFTFTSFYNNKHGFIIDCMEDIFHRLDSTKTNQSQIVEFVLNDLPKNIKELDKVITYNMI